MNVVLNAKLVGDGEQDRVGLCDRLVVSKLLNQHPRFGGIGPAEDRARGSVDVAGLVPVLPLSSEIGKITVVDQCEDAAANRNTRSTSVTSFLPGRAKGTNLGRLLDMERLAGFVKL